MPLLYRPKVLVLDSDAKHISILKKGLSKEGLEVIGVSNMKDGHGQLSLTNVDVIITRFDRSDENELRTFYKDLNGNYPMILVGKKKRKEISKEWLNLADDYVEEDKIAKKLGQVTVDVLQSRIQKIKQAA